MGLLLAIPRIAAAQSPGPPLPVGMDLRNVPLGVWADYKLTVPQIAPFRQRFALVGKDSGTSTVEMAAEGGMMAAGKRVVLKVTLGSDLTKPDRVKKVLMQLGDNDPMELPAQMSMGKEHFAPIDPKKAVGTEQVKVPAGTFKARRYKDKSTNGTEIEVWVSQDVPPFGIVKMQGSVKQPGSAESHPLVVELVGRGKGAKPTVTKPPVPFDGAKLMEQMNGTLAPQKK